MSNNNQSINEFEFQLICEYFSSIDRQGPGSDAHTLEAFSCLKDLPANPIIADLGCGTGSSSLALAKHTQAHITAIDLFPQFIEKLKARAHQASVSERINAMVGDMGKLIFEEDSLDVIWSEGAIYFIGFLHGLKEWHRLIKPGGYVVVTDASWFTEERPKEIEDFWMEAYPEIDTIANKIKQMEQAGYRIVKTFTLPEYCWIDNFYTPQKDAQRLFLEHYPNNMAAHEFIKYQQHEAELYNKYKDYYGYVFYIGQK